MSNIWFHVLAGALSGTVAIFTAVTGFAILILVRFWRNRSRQRMDAPLPYPQSVEIEVAMGLLYLGQNSASIITTYLIS